MDSTKWIIDESWYKSVHQRMAAIFSFYKKHGLLRSPEALPETDKVVLRFSDFTDLGQKFRRTGAEDRWLNSFDRPGSKKADTDVSYLQKQLIKITEADD